MDFVNVGGSDTNADSLIESMLESGLIVAKSDGGKICYAKTEDGVHLHAILRHNNYLGPLFELLGRKKLKRKKDDQDTK